MKHTTIAAFLMELVETYMQKCDDAAIENGDEPNPHIVSETYKTRANITTLANVSLGAETLIVIELDDGSSFNVRVSET